MLVLKDQTACSGKPFEYFCPETGEIILCSNWPGFVYKVRDYRFRKKLPIPLDFFRIIQHNWCLDHPNMCKDEDAAKIAPSPAPQPAPASSKIAYPNLLTQLKSFIKDSSEWAKMGFRQSEKELAEMRLGHCVQCEFWSGGRSFLSFRCRKCGCRMKLKVANPRSHCPIHRW